MGGASRGSGIHVYHVTTTQEEKYSVVIKKKKSVEILNGG